MTAALVIPHTEGPWDWFENMPGRPYLATPDRGRLYVMGFERKGMQGATPMFARWPGMDECVPRRRTGGLMMPGLWLPDGSMHPDAALIKAAPLLLDALKKAADYLSCIPEAAAGGDDVAAGILKAALAAIDEAVVRHG